MEKQDIPSTYNRAHPEFEFKIRAAAELLAKWGIFFRCLSPNEEDTEVALPPEQVYEFILDNEAWYAKQEGVTKEIREDFRSWYYTESSMCRGKMEDGSPCIGHGAVGYRRAADFKPGITDRCLYHQVVSSKL